MPKLNKFLSLILSFCLILEQSVFAQTIDLSHYFARNSSQTIYQSDKFRPLHLRYLGYDNLSQDFNILLDKGDIKKEDLDSKAYLEENTQTLLKYFFIGLALPNEKFWVNLRPDSPDNILDLDLEKTDIGRIFLEADLQLKKDTSGMTSPQTPEGKAYWDKLYKKAGELFGSENITIPTIARPWIVPNEIIIREAPDNAYIYKATLKVMLEEDYLIGRGGSRTAPTPDQYIFSDPRLKELNQYSTQIIKETIIPKLTYAVNTAKRYAQLRQVYYSLILAQWFKQKYGGLGSARASGPSAPVNSYVDLIDSGNLVNLASREPCDKQAYFQQYQKSFKDGEYNLQDTVYTPMGQSVRRYMSGGIVMSSPVVTTVENKDGYVLNRPYLESMHYDVIYSSLNPGDIMNVKKTSVVSSAVQNEKVDEIILEESYISAVRQIEENDRHPLPFREPLFDKNFIQETIKKLRLPLTDNRIVNVTEREFSSNYKRILLITLFASDGSSAKFILYMTAHKQAVKGYRRGEEEMEKDPELKIFPLLGAEREYHVGDLEGMIWLSAEYVDSEVSVSHIDYNERIRSKITTVFKMLSKRLLVESVFQQLVTTLDDSGKIIVKVVDLDLLVYVSNRFEINLLPQIEEIFNYAQQNLAEIPEKTPLIVAELGVNYCKKDDLTGAYKMFYEKSKAGNSSGSFPSVEQFKRFVETLVSSSSSEISKAPAEVFPMHTHSVSSAVEKKEGRPDQSISTHILESIKWLEELAKGAKSGNVIYPIFKYDPASLGFKVTKYEDITIVLYNFIKNAIEEGKNDKKAKTDVFLDLIAKAALFFIADTIAKETYILQLKDGEYLKFSDITGLQEFNNKVIERIIAKRFIHIKEGFEQIGQRVVYIGNPDGEKGKGVVRGIGKEIAYYWKGSYYATLTPESAQNILSLFAAEMRELLRELYGGKHEPKDKIVGSTSSPATSSNKGGIAFNALPIQTESVASSALGVLPGGRAFKGDLDVEWGRIQDVFSAGIRPSIQRLSEYTAAAADSPLAGDKIDQVRVMLADILRRDEESQKLVPAEESCKQLLRALEAG